MRIAQVAPLYESVPPRLYGGTERVVSYLTEELVAQGHEVTLFASGESQTSAELVPVCEQALRLSGRMRYDIAAHVYMLEELRRRAAEFDLIHFHTELIHVPLARALGRAHVTTLHGRIDLPELLPSYTHARDLPFVSISDAQRQPLGDAEWVGTVHHGLPDGYLSVAAEPGSYLAFLGRISPEKGVDRAIDIAARAGRRLLIAAKLEDLDRAYYEHIKPLLAQPHVEFIGEVDEAGKAKLLAGAEALLFPIDWPEPFGLVMVEAMFCGTPVVAFRRGSVPEIVDPGVTGFVVEDVGSAVSALDEVGRIDRRACAATARRRFSAGRMAADYLRLYEPLVTRGGARSTSAA